MQLKKIYYSIISLDALFEGGRLFVGATAASYLLSQGVSLSQIALLKSLQAIILIFGEVPTGLLADTFGRKKSLLISLATSIVGFLLYFTSKHFAAYLLAEAMIALSLCFWSGAYEAYAIDTAKLEERAGLMDRFFHMSQALNSAAILVFGYLGGVIAKGGLGLPYLGAALVFMCTFIGLLPLPESHTKTDERVTVDMLVQKVRTAIKSGFLSKKLAPYFWANIAIQFAIQPLLQFWQPLFQSINHQATSETLGRIFTIYCATNLVFGALAARYSKRKFFQSPAFTAALFLLFGLAYVVTGLTSNFIVAIAAFSLCQGFLSVGRTALSVRFNEAITGLPRATVLSSLSLVSRIGMIGALGFLSGVTRFSAGQNHQTLYITFGLFSVICASTALVGVLASRKRATANQEISATA